jgi:hypothetical protein
VLVRAAATDVPPNVAEARAWIAAWRAKQAGGAAPAAAANGASSNGMPKAATNGRPAAAGGGGKFTASASFSDGTLVFTADQLQSVNYGDVLKANKK